MRVVLTGGGTGGHVIPNMAIIEELRKEPDIEILYIGSKEGIEKKMIEKIGIRYEGIHCGKFRRYFSLKNFVDFFKVPLGMLGAYKKLRGFSPDVIFSKGGFVSVPVVIAASRLEIPVIVHESDVSPGLANKICFRFADKICVSFEETKAYLPKKFEKKAIVTGNPVRESVLKGDAEKGYVFTGFNKYRPVILIMGGSQGSQQINELVRSGLDELLKKFQIVHLAGRGNIDIGVHQKGYVQYEYLDEQLKDVYAMCELVLCRGGANSLFESALLKKKVLIFPLATSASRGEQINNATVFANKMGWTMITGSITREDFIDNIIRTFHSEIRHDKSLKNGTEEIVDLILKTAK